MCGTMLQLTEQPGQGLMIFLIFKVLYSFADAMTDHKHLNAKISQGAISKKFTTNISLSIPLIDFWWRKHMQKNGGDWL